MGSVRFERLAGAASVLVGLGGLVYAILFIWIVAGAPNWVLETWFALLLGGAFLTVVVAATLYGWLRRVDVSLALAATLFATLGALDGVLHGATNLYRLLNPASPGPGEVVTAGALRYGAAGLALLGFGALILSSDLLPRALGWLLGFSGGILVLIFFGRLFQFITPTVKVSLIPPVLYGLVLHPMAYVWLGVEIRRRFGLERGAVD